MFSDLKAIYQHLPRLIYCWRNISIKGNIFLFIQGITEHPHAVSAILYSGLSASAIASYKWNSVAAKRRLTEDPPECPELKYYPLPEDGIRNIETVQ